jgi:acyl-CoA thioester hydrolase
MERRGVIFPVSEAFCRYHAPARYDDLLTFRTWISEIRGVRIKISSKVFCGDKLLVSGHIVLASVNADLKIVRLDPEVVEACKKFIWNEEEAQ